MRQFGTLRRLRKPIAAWQNVCAPRHGASLGHRAGQGGGAGARVQPVQGESGSGPGIRSEMEGHAKKLRGQHRFASGAAARPCTGRHFETHLRSAGRPVPDQQGAAFLLLLPGLGGDVQARRRRVLRHRCAPGPFAGTVLHPAASGHERTAGRQHGGSGGSPGGTRSEGVGRRWAGGVVRVGHGQC